MIDRMKEERKVIYGLKMVFISVLAPVYCMGFGAFYSENAAMVGFFVGLLLMTPLLFLLVPKLPSSIKKET